MMLGESGEECLDHTYETFIAQLKDINCRGSFCWRPWIWQTCTEFGWYQTTNQDSGIYGSSLDLGFFEQWCQDAFGPEFTHEMLEKNVYGSNIEYGGDHPDVDNVVFVHGTIDPWHATTLSTSGWYLSTGQLTRGTPWESWRTSPPRPRPSSSTAPPTATTCTATEAPTLRR